MTLTTLAISNGSTAPTICEPEAQGLRFMRELATALQPVVDRLEAVRFERSEQGAAMRATMLRNRIAAGIESASDCVEFYVMQNS